MSAQRISGKDFYVFCAGRMIHVESASLSIEDSSTVAMSHGIPNGWVDGETKAQGELEVDTANFLIFTEIAKEAGSWKRIPPFDIMYIASTLCSGGFEGMNVEAFGCKLKINDLLSIDPKGAEKSKTKLTFDVTDSDFVKINGVPYLAACETFGIV
jgi:hypothetical protein